MPIVADPLTQQLLHPAFGPRRPRWPRPRRRPVFAYGNFITILINFIILAFIIFLMIKQMNRLKREAAGRPHRRRPRDVLLLRRSATR